MKKLVMYTDGGARGNPGPAAYGVVIYDDRGVILAKLKRYLGELTNNQAEYEGVIAGLEKADALGASEVECFLDSELVARQLVGQYRIKNSGLRPLAARAFALAKKFTRVNYTHVKREKNQLADELVNQAIDQASA